MVPKIADAIVFISGDCKEICQWNAICTAVSIVGPHSEYPVECQFSIKELFSENDFKAAAERGTYLKRKYF